MVWFPSAPSIMAESSAPKTTVDSFTIKGTNKIIKVGDCVLIRSRDRQKPRRVAKVDKIEADGKIHIRWYYRPEQSIGGLRHFHGANELFFTDHFSVQNADRIVGKCKVHSFRSYVNLDTVDDNKDYYCRFDYNHTTGVMSPDKVVVYCKCEMPMNPDVLMIRCEDCGDRFHPACISMTEEEAEELEHFICSDCSSQDK